MKQKNTNIDAAFIDEAWADMKQLLDQEMPVKKKKRRFLWIWLFPIGLIAGLSSQYWGKGADTPVSSFPISKNQMTQPVASLDKPTEKTEAPVLNTKTTTDKVVKSITPADPLLQETKTPKTINPVKPENKHPKEAIVPDASKPQSLEKKPLQENSKINGTIDDKPKSQLQQAAIPNEPPNDNSTVIANETLDFPKRMTLPADLLPGLDFSPEYTSPVLTVPQPKLPSKRWSFGVFGGYVFSNNTSWQAGLLSEVRLTPRWALQAGLSYTKLYIGDQQEQSFQNDLGLSLENDVEIPETADPGQNSPIGMEEEETQGATGGATPPQETVSSTLFEIKNGHYLSLSLSAQYRLSPRWSLQSGVQGNYLLGYSYTLNGQSAYSTNTGALAAQESRNFTQPLNLDQLNTFQYSIFGGIGFHINNRLRVFGHYYHGLNHHFKQEILDANTLQGTPKKLRYFEIGASYFIF